MKVPHRITNPRALSVRQIIEASASDRALVVQFDQPDAVTPAILETLNQAFGMISDRLEVRFFGHAFAPFDAAVLRHLPDACSLSIDNLSTVLHAEEIGRMPALRRLTFGVYDFHQTDFLDSLPLSQLEVLVLGDTRTAKLDLKPLAACTSLDDLFVCRHFRNIEAISGLPRLRRLGLNTSGTKHTLEFVRFLPALRALKLVLGSRSSIDELRSTTIEMLQIVRVLGLRSLGDLSRIPALSALSIQNQPQVAQLDLTRANLERLRIYDCRRLATLPGLEKQQRLREFAAGGVALDLDTLRDMDWPAATHSVRLLSRNGKWEDDAKARLAARGLDGVSGYWP